jgi:hypothetical protein
MRGRRWQLWLLGGFVIFLGATQGVDWLGRAVGDFAGTLGRLAVQVMDWAAQFLRGLSGP